MASMTKHEFEKKRAILEILREQGYPTYAKLLDMFTLNVTKDPDVVAYMEPDAHRIVVNDYIKDESSISLVVRHEILHEYFTHYAREMLWRENHKDRGISHQTVNIAADYDISNKGYTDADKYTVRTLTINSRLMRGLVTEDDRPDLVDKSFEEMLDILSEDEKNIEQDMQQEIQQNQQNQSQGQGKGSSSKGSGNSQQNKQQDSSGNGSGKSSDQNDKQKSKSKSGAGNSDDQSGNEEESDDKNKSGSGKSDKDDASDEENGASQSDDGEDTDAESGDNSDGSEDGDSEDEDSGYKPGQMGYRGNKADREKEDAERQAQIEKEQEEGTSPQEDDDDLDDLEKIARIKKAFDDLANDGDLNDSDLVRETNLKKQKENQAKIAKEIAKYNNSPLKRFEASFSNFLKTAMGLSRGKTWGKINKTYAGSDLLKKGLSRRRPDKVPSVNVYFDRSGSWDESKTKQGYQIISTFNNYVKQGRLKINLYYFSVNVHTDEQAAKREGGTYGQPILNHIKETNPDNVVIMTDSDISDCYTPVTVPGAVWLLFVTSRGYGTDRSQNLIDNLHGSKLTEIYDVVLGDN